MDAGRLQFQKGAQNALLREHANLADATQEEVAALFGVPRRTYRNWLIERLLLPAWVFVMITKSYPALRGFGKKIMRVNERSWGQKLGGKKAIARIMEKYGEAELGKRRVKGGKESANLRLKSIRSRMPVSSDPDLAEFLGALMGDGWMGEYGRRKQVAICGNLKELQYARHVIALSKKIFGIKPYLLRRSSTNTFYLIINNSVVFDYFTTKFNFPKGKKTRFGIEKLPANWELQKRVIQGLFDTDGSIYFDKSKSYKKPYPTVEIASKNVGLKEWLKTTLKQKGYTPVLHARGVRIKGFEDITRWFKEINPQNNAKAMKYRRWMRLYYAGP